VPELVDEMEHIEVLSHATIQITPSRLGLLRDVSNLMGVAICGLVLIFYYYGAVFADDGTPIVGP
jgi:hypothetical protein